MSSSAHIYDVAVIGLGTMGSASALELARRKTNVIGFDQFPVPHGNGSHSGQTRIFRIAHYDTPQYVPLAKRASQLWDDLSFEAQTPLLTRIGFLKMGPPRSSIIEGIRHCAEHYQLSLDEISADEIRYRYPAFHIPDDFMGFEERTAGWIDVDSAITVMQSEARRLGAELCTDEPVVQWRSDGDTVTVQTSLRRIQAHHLIVTAGAWTKPILSDLGLPIRIVRKTFFWFDPLVSESFSERAIPIFGFPPNIFYGFPNIRNEGVKVAEHCGGDDLTTPESVSEAASSDSVLDTVGRFLPSLAGAPRGDSRRIVKTATCLYSLTPDEHFYLDLHPQWRNVAFAAGFSGHGFKFAPVIGEIMADLALRRTTALPIDFLRCSRIATPSAG